jgi:hypothetical protein
MNDRADMAQAKRFSTCWSSRQRNSPTLSRRRSVQSTPQSGDTCGANSMKFYAASPRSAADFLGSLRASTSRGNRPTGGESTGSRTCSKAQPA